MDSFKRIVVSSLGFALKTFWACLFISFFFILVVVTLKYAGSVKSSDLASWVQAVGSIGAIAGAYAVANWQIQKQKHQQEVQDKNRLQAMYAVVKCAAEHLESTRVFAVQRPPRVALNVFWQHMSGAFEASMEALKVLPVHELGRAELVINCMFIIGAMSKLQSKINQYMDSGTDEQLEETYTEIITHADLSMHSWKQFSKYAGINSDLQDYNI
ncbi:hypothetical protein [Pseudomonas rhodesiae]|uniref:hypothetical protein n=1 Tax=Pseudomonas rhodesiae TaxID=76760 RepID=UPI0028D87253|nr:hypothetical protein [Pseudomonas rhodesiae]